MKKASSNEFLSSAAADYYLRFGKSRGIEKYFRKSCNRHADCHKNKTCSDSSLQSLSDNLDNPCCTVDGIAKSLENLNLAKSYIDFEALSSKPSVKQITKDSEIRLDKSEEPSTTDQSIQTTSKKNSQKKIFPNEKKNINVNLESKIEIRLPEPVQSVASNIQDSGNNIKYPAFILSSQLPSSSSFIQHPQTKIMYSTDTQTSIPEVNVYEFEAIEEPIKPVIIHPERNDNIVINKDVSPASSIASKEQQKLEWDPAADVGYDTLQIYNSSELTNSERKALKEYLFQKGIEMDSGFLVLKNKPDKQNNILIVKSKNKQTVSEESQENYKENWKQIYSKYKKKYQELNSQNLANFNPFAQSTPIEEPDKVCLVEKSAQTSHLDLSSKYVQVDNIDNNQIIESINNHDLSKKESHSLASSKQNYKEDETALSNNEGFTLDTESFVYVTKTSLEQKPDSSYRSSSRHRRSLMSEYSSTQKTKSTNSKHENCFEEEMRMAVALINSVLESKTMHTDLKKSLVSKVMQKIVNLKLSNTKLGPSTDNKLIDSSSTTSKDTTMHPNRRVDSFSSSDALTSSNKDTSSDKTFCKAPLSNISNRIQKCEVSSREVPKKLELSGEKRLSNEPKEPLSSSSAQSLPYDPPTGEIVDALKPMTHSELDYENRKASNSSDHESTKRLDVNLNINASNMILDPKEKKKEALVTKNNVAQLLWIETEIQRLFDLKKKLHLGESRDDGRRESSNASTSNVSQKTYENIDLKIHNKKNVIQYKSSGGKSSEWNSHNIALKSDRSKLLTPNPENNLAEIVQKRKEEFAELYEKKRGKLYDGTAPIYTRPYSTGNDGYSNFKHIVISHGEYKNSKEKQSSLSSCDFLSSRSISVPIGNTVTNTTTHQYDMKSDKSSKYEANKQKIVATQTTDSLKRTIPIFENKISVSSQQKTQMIHPTTLNKQLQTKPEPLAYVLTFNQQKKTIENIHLQKAKHDDTKKKPKRSTNNQIVYDENDFDFRTLTEHLNEKRPETWRKMDQRNHCIKELRRLRELRNEQRKKLILLTSEKSLRERMKKLPPSPLSKKITTCLYM